MTRIVAIWAAYQRRPGSADGRLRIFRKHSMFSLYRATADIEVIKALELSRSPINNPHAGKQKEGPYELEILSRGVRGNFNLPHI